MKGVFCFLGCFVESDLSLLVDGVVVGGGVEEGLSLPLPLLLRLVVRVLVDLFLGGGVLSESDEDEDEEEVDESDETGAAFLVSPSSSVALESVDVFRGLLSETGMVAVDSTTVLAALGFLGGEDFESLLESISDEEEAGRGFRAGLSVESINPLPEDIAEDEEPGNDKDSPAGDATVGIEVAFLPASDFDFLSALRFLSTLTSFAPSTLFSTSAFLSPLSTFTFLSGCTFLSILPFSDLASSFAFLVREGLSSLMGLSVESDVGSEPEAAFRFSLLTRLLTVGLGEGALAALVSFSSSASLSEVGDDEDVDEEV